MIEINTFSNVLPFKKMAENIIFNVSVNGKGDLNNLDKGVESVGKKAGKTQTEVKKLRDEIKRYKDVMLVADEGSIEYANALSKVSAAQFKLKDINDKRNTIIDFASRVSSSNAIVTREYFNRIFKTYQEYEDMIKKEGLTNGEVDVAYHIIVEAYEERLSNHTFLEDERGW